MLVHKLKLNELYQHIELLSVDAKQKFDNAEYEQIPSILVKRLELLRELCLKMSTFDTSSQIYHHYLSFLQSLKKSDKIETERLFVLRKSVLAETTQQENRKKAVNTYNRVSLNK
jgi:hypothetical protein